MQTKFMKTFLVLLVSVVIPLILRQIAKAKRRERGVARERLRHIVDILSLRGGNAHAAEYLEEALLLIRRHRFNLHEVDVEDFHELAEIARKAYRVHSFLEHLRHARLKEDFWKSLRRRDENFKEIVLSEVAHFGNAYEKSLDSLKEMKRTYEQLRTFAALWAPS